MSTRLINIDRETPMLFPVRVQDWVPENHLSRFIVEAVDTLDTSAFKVNETGSGDEEMPPTMMLSLLIYSYATGLFGSRKIAAATYTDVALMYICGGKVHPHFTVICEFRRRNREAFKEAFTKVLLMAVEMKQLKKVGKISVDGTKIRANASKHKAVSYKRAGEMIEEIEGEVEALTAKAEGEDQTPLEEGLTVPDEIGRREERKAALEKAKAVMEERYKEAEEEDKAEKAKKAKKAAKAKKTEESGEAKETGKAEKAEKKSGKEVKPLEKYQYNYTDPESRIMKAGTGNHFEQCYNAEAAVDAEGSMLILGGYVTDHGNDKKELVPAVESVDAGIREVTGVLSDTGFYSEAAVKAVEREDENGVRQGPEVFCAVEKTGHHRSVQDLEVKEEKEVKEEGTEGTEEGKEGSEKTKGKKKVVKKLTAKGKMAEKLKTKEGREIYKKRKETVEPVFGIIKSAMGFRQFLLRGLEKVSTEWELVKAAYNFKKLHRLLYGIPVPKCPVLA
jgi:transposase